jgi:hypothetical protein
MISGVVVVVCIAITKRKYTYAAPILGFRNAQSDSCIARFQQLEKAVQMCHEGGEVFGSELAIEQQQLCPERGVAFRHARGVAPAAAALQQGRMLTMQRLGG